MSDFQIGLRVTVYGLAKVEPLFWNAKLTRFGVVHSSAFDWIVRPSKCDALSLVVDVDLEYLPSLFPRNASIPAVTARQNHFSSRATCVSPNFASCNHAYQTSRDAKLSCHGDVALASCSAISNQKHLFIGENRMTVVFTIDRGRTLFAGTIRVVFGERSQKQMIRINTQRNVALMKHAQPWRNRSIRDLKRDSMSAVSDLPDFHHSIFATVVTTRRASPKPALSTLVDLSPKPLNVYFHDHLHDSKDYTA